MKKGLLITLKAFMDFIPLILLWNIRTDFGLILSLLFSFLLIVINISKKQFSLMSNVVFLYLTITNSFYWIFNINYFFDKRNFLSYVVLTLMCFISIKLYKPFTIYASRKAYSSICDTALFIEMNIIITRVFGLCYLINSIMAFWEVRYLNIISIFLTLLAIMSSIILPSLMPDV